MLLRLLTLLSLVVVAAADFHGWINEFHYRNSGPDTELFIEVVGPAGEEAYEYVLVMYQGRDGSQFDEAISLSGHKFDLGVEHDFGFIKHVFPDRRGVIRNGKSHGDAIALIYKDQCVQFLCYGNQNVETFTAWTGPCIGQTCHNIGVHETRFNPVGQSLQMIGQGRLMEDFTWLSETQEWSPGEVNTGQDLQTTTEYVSPVVVRCHASEMLMYRFADKFLSRCRLIEGRLVAHEKIFVSWPMRKLALGND